MMKEGAELPQDISAWLEFEQINKDSKTYFLIHISFPTENEAKALFPIKKEEWSLPLTLKENRIIISSAAIDTQFVSGQYFKINFIKRSDAQNFFNFIELVRKSWDKSLPIIEIYLDDHYDYSSVYLNGFIHPYYSIANRKNAHDQLVNHCIFKLLELNNLGLLPKDLSLLIAMNIYNLSASDISKQFKVPQDHFEQPYQKIDCDIKYSLSPKRDQNNNLQYNLHLVCLNDTDFAKLVKNLEISKISLNARKEKNEIIIPPLFYLNYEKEIKQPTTFGTFSTININTGEISIGIKFRSPAEAAIFNSFINFTKKIPAISDDGFCFQVSDHELPEKEEEKTVCLIS